MFIEKGLLSRVLNSVGVTYSTYTHFAPLGLVSGVSAFL